MDDAGKGVKGISLPIVDMTNVWSLKEELTVMSS